MSHEDDASFCITLLRREKSPHCLRQIAHVETNPCILPQHLLSDVFPSQKPPTTHFTLCPYPLSQPWRSVIATSPSSQLSAKTNGPRLSQPPRSEGSLLAPRVFRDTKGCRLPVCRPAGCPATGRKKGPHHAFMGRGMESPRRGGDGCRRQQFCMKKPATKAMHTQARQTLTIEDQHKQAETDALRDASRDERDEGASAEALGRVVSQCLGSKGTVRPFGANW